MSKPRKKKCPRKRVLALPDLEQSKTAVLNTSLQKAVSAAMIAPSPICRLVLFRTAPRIQPQRGSQKREAATTINLRLAAVQRVAFEAADSGLLSPELAAGIRRVKGVRR